jgi:anti-sigma B factor antagonist
VTGMATFSQLGAVDLVRLVGEVDVANAGLVGEEIERHTRSAANVVIDLSAVPFLDSAGVRLLDSLVGGYERRGAHVRLVVPPTGGVRMTLRLCAFREELLAPDTATAAAALQR